MPKQQRGRACHNCHTIKIKCELGTYGGDPPCTRCLRLGKECAVLAPKRQKDRVMELEAKVAALTKLLEAQGLKELSPEASDGKGSGNDEGEVVVNGKVALADREKETQPSSNRNAESAQKKRKLTDQRWEAVGAALQGNPTPASTSSSSDSKPGNKFDELLSDDLQQRILDHFTSTLSPMFPAVPLSAYSDVNTLRQTRPLLLDAVLFAAVPCFTSIEIQDQLTLALLDKLVSATLVHGDRSFDLLQALQIASLWYRSARKHSHIAAFQMISIASGMAVDLGFGGPQYPRPVPFLQDERLVSSVESKRAWLVSYALVSGTSIYKRRPSEQKWTDHHDVCLKVLESAEDALQSDRLLAQFVRAERLCANISDRLSFADFSPCPVVGEPFSRFITTELETQIRDFMSQIPADLSRPSLSFLGAYADILAHEPVLHNSSNKQSFAAPYSSESTMMLDIPSPTVTEDHVNALYRLRTSCHTLLDATASFTDAELLSLPSFLSPPRVAYTTYILLKLHIAVTAPGNTYGNVLTAQDVKAAAYIDTCIALAAKLHLIDSEAVMTRILGFSTLTKEWLQHYEKSRLAVPRGATMLASQIPGLNELNREYIAARNSYAQNTASYNVSNVSDGVDAGWDNFVDLGFTTDDFGLANLFAGSDLDAWMLDYNYVSGR